MKENKTMFMNQFLTPITASANFLQYIIISVQTLWPESASKLYRLSNRCLSLKLEPTFADRGCHVVSMTDPYGRFLDFYTGATIFFFQVAPQLYSRG
jgi:hypothetical protein